MICNLVQVLRRRQEGIESFRYLNLDLEGKSKRGTVRGL